MATVDVAVTVAAAVRTEVQEAMGQLPSESDLSWLGLNRRLGLSDGAALFTQLEQVRGRQEGAGRVGVVVGNSG